MERYLRFSSSYLVGIILTSLFTAVIGGQNGSVFHNHFRDLFSAVSRVHAVVPLLSFVAR